MNYVKKMCILRQIKQGFSGDGKALTGLIKLEQYGKNLAIEVSVINFAPLSSGEYYCLIADEKGRTEMLPLRGKSLFNIITALDISRGFCGVICFVKNGIYPIAYGANGDKVYDWRALVADALGEDTGREIPFAATAATEKNERQEKPVKLNPAPVEPAPAPAETNAENSRRGAYDDEEVAKVNYYQSEEENERNALEKDLDDDEAESGDQKQEKTTEADLEENGNASRVLHPFAQDPDGYYLSVKAELDELFARYEKDERLKDVFECSEWVRITDGEKAEQLVGVIYEDWKAKYLCYALPTQDGSNPPEEIAEICVFVPATPFDTSAGFFVIFQSAATGECIKPEKL